jgi:hypothetical protein
MAHWPSSAGPCGPFCTCCPVRHVVELPLNSNVRHHKRASLVTQHFKQHEYERPAPGRRRQRTLKDAATAWPVVQCKTAALRGQVRREIHAGFESQFVGLQPRPQRQLRWAPLRLQETQPRTAGHSFSCRPNLHAPCSAPLSGKVRSSVLQAFPLTSARDA